MTALRLSGVCTSGLGLALVASVSLTGNALAVGGDTIAEATNIPGLPYNDTGNTSSFNDDYDEVCPYTGSTSPDVVYSYTPGQDVDVNIILCDSGYDTKVYVYDTPNPPGGSFVACNDDGCNADPNFRSDLFCVSLSAGTTYYIVIDGWGGDAGSYQLLVEEGSGCSVECPPEGILEGEPICGPDYDDTYNGGCNSTVPIFSDIACGDVICGESGTFIVGGSNNYRDTDWYELVLTQGSPVTWSIIAEFDALIFIIDGTAGCDGLTILQSGTTGPFIPFALSDVVSAGTYWFWAGPSVFAGIPCGAQYVSELNCAPPDGACCLEDGSCMVMTADDCDDAGGLYQGDDTTCLEVLCPDINGNDACADALAIGPVNCLPFWTYFASANDPVTLCTQGAGNLWYLYTAEATGLATATVVGDDDAAVGVYEGDCGGVFGNQIACDNSGGDASVTWSVVMGESYLIEVAGDQTGETLLGCLSVFVGTPPPPTGVCCVDEECVATTTEDICIGLGGSFFEGEACYLGFECPCISCPPGSIPEGEPDCGPDYDDTYNGGCNSGTPVFASINCGDTICGRAGTFPFGGSNYRDTDWYEFDLGPTTTDVVWTGAGDFPFLLFIVNGDAGCDAVQIITSLSIEPCVEDSISASTSGLTWVLAMPSVFEGVPCGSVYYASLQCGDECDWECPAGSVEEGEPLCADEYDDTFNGGCNSTPPVFSSINLDEVVCGTTGTFSFAGNNYRDTDWYLNNEIGSGDTVTWTGAANFAPFILFVITDPGAECGDDITAVSVVAELCNEEVSIEAAVGADQLYFFAGPNVFAGINCANAEYWVELSAGGGCVGDVDGDGDVDVSDLLDLLAAWGTNDPDADLDGNMIVNVSDLLILLADWGCTS